MPSAAALVAVALLGSAARPRRRRLTPSTLAVAGRTNATPWVAARGTFVAVAWGARQPGSESDVFVAISRDGARTFGAPVQVNAMAGEARLGGEMPPRVALRARPGRPIPTIVVLWTARR